MVTVVGVDDENTETSDDDDHTTVAEDVAPEITVEKSGPPTVLEGGATALYSFVITASADNASSDPVTVTAIGDDVLGDLLPAALAANGGASIVLQPGESFSFDVEGEVDLNADESLTNVVTVVGVDDENTETSDDDDHTTVAEDVAPEITVEKSGPPTVLEGGATALYSFVITASADNASSDPVTVTAIGDDVLGDLLPAALAANGGASIVLQPGESFSFDVEGEVDLNADESLTNVVTVVGVDDENTETSDDDDHTTVAEDVAPEITVEKSGPPTVLEGGATALYSFVITASADNASSDPVTVTAIGDDVLGDLLPAALAANGGASIVLQPGESFSFDVEGEVDLNAGESLTNVVTVVGVDDENTETSDDDDHTTVVENLVPEIIVDKVANTTSVSEPKGGEVTYSVTIMASPDNASSDPVTVTSITDAIWYDANGDDIEDPGEVTDVDLLGLAEAANGGEPIMLQPGESFNFEYTEFVQGNPWEDPVNTVTVIGEDDDGTEVSDDDDAVVDITQKNQRSLEVDLPSGSDAVRVEGDQLSGTVTITDASDEPPEVDALLTFFDLTMEVGKGKKRAEADITIEQIWGDSDGDGILDTGENVLTDLDPTTDGYQVGLLLEEPADEITLGWTVSFDDGMPEDVRATFFAQTDGRGKVFSEKESYDDLLA